MFYRVVRAIVSTALRLFYRLEVVRHVDDLSGPVMFVGNHPNSLIDPALVFVITDRPVTFLAREPLFRVPVMGWVLRGVGALPIFRKQDHAADMQKNDATLEAASKALIEQRAITIFPEGKSHSAPQLADIKTGCARIALRVAQTGSALRIIPVGLTYEQKHRFKSTVHIEIGQPLLVQAVAAGSLDGDAQVEWVRALTTRVGEALRNVTLNLEDWEDLSLVTTADQLFALRNGFRAKDPERLRLLAKGAALFRRDQPERFEEIKEELMSFRTRLNMVNADAQELSVQYRARQVAVFVVRNLAAMILGLPLLALGLVLFAGPFLALRFVSRLMPLAQDRLATLKVVSALVVVPLWWALLCVGGWAWAQTWGLVLALVGSLPLALFTRYFLERRKAMLSDIAAFLKLGNRARLQQHLLFEGERLQEDIQRLVSEFKPRVDSQST